MKILAEKWNQRRRKKNNAEIFKTKQQTILLRDWSRPWRCQLRKFSNHNESWFQVFYVCASVWFFHFCPSAVFFGTIFASPFQWNSTNYRLQSMYIMLFDVRICTTFLLLLTLDSGWIWSMELFDGWIVCLSFTYM